MSLAVALSASRGRCSSCAVRLPDGEVVASPGGQHRGSELLAVLAETIRSVGGSARDIDAVRVDVGPGSYTGLRVALTCARFLARFATHEMASVETATSFDLIATQVLPGHPVGTELHCLLDARRDRVYHATLTLDPTDRLEVVRPPEAHALDALDLAPNSTQSRIAVADPAMASRFADELESFDTLLEVPDYTAADLFDTRVRLRAETVDSVQPLYLMGSYATE